MSSASPSGAAQESLNCFAAGKDTPESDIDLWIYIKDCVDTIELKNVTRKIETDFMKEVKLLVLTDKKIKDLKENDPEFYFRLKLTSVERIYLTELSDCFARRLLTNTGSSNGLARKNLKYMHSRLTA